MKVPESSGKGLKVSEGIFQPPLFQLSKSQKNILNTFEDSPFHKMINMGCNDHQVKTWILKVPFSYF